MFDPRINDFTGQVIGAAIEVHKALGPGLLESSYEKCLCRELGLRGVPFIKQYPLPLEYKGLKLEQGYRVDILIGNLVPVELKTVDCLHPIHEAQLLTYMRLGKWRIGLLINFNVEILKHGIKRLAL